MSMRRTPEPINPVSAFFFSVDLTPHTCYPHPQLSFLAGASVEGSPRAVNLLYLRSSRGLRR
jgi:hypothetical protein